MKVDRMADHLPGALLGNPPPTGFPNAWRDGNGFRAFLIEKVERRHAGRVKEWTSHGQWEEQGNARACGAGEWDFCIAGNLRRILPHFARKPGISDQWSLHGI